MSLAITNASVIMPFLSNLNNLHISDDTKFLYIEKYLKYLLGTISYKNTIDFFPKEIATIFRNCLFSFTENQVYYTRVVLRKYTRDNKVLLHKVDELWIQIIQPINLNNIKILRYPKLADIIKDMMPTLRKVSGNLYKSTNSNFRKTHSFEGLLSFFTVRLIELYKLYIHSFKTVLDEKAFYKILHRTVSGSSIDLLRAAKASKRNVKICSLDSEYENSVSVLDTLQIDSVNDLSSRWAPSPEYSFLYKEQINKSPLPKNFKLNLYNNSISEDDRLWM